MPLRFHKEKLATPVDPTRVPYITRTAEFRYQPRAEGSYDLTGPCAPGASPPQPSPETNFRPVHLHAEQ